MAFELCSGSLRIYSVPASPLLRECFGSASAVLRDGPEALSKPSRSVAEHVSNKPRRGPEALPKSTRRGAERIPSSDKFQINFGLLCRIDENPSKGRSWSGVGRYLSLTMTYLCPAYTQGWNKNGTTQGKGSFRGEPWLT